MTAPGAAKRTARRGFAAFALAAVLAIVVVPPAVAQQEATEAGAVTGALETVASCLSANEKMLVAFVIDESASLVETDPENRRVEAARLALRSFADLANAEGTDSPPEIEAFVGAFARNFTPAADWGALDDPEEFARLDAAIGGFAERNLAVDTDIPTALHGAQQELAERAAAISGDEPCKVVVLFTDGEFSLNDGDFAGEDSTRIYAPDIDLREPGTAAAAMERGVEFLCEAGGVADTLRNDGAVVLTAALTSAIAPEDQAFLEAISTGESGDVTCGSDSGARYGAFLPAADVQELVEIFNRIGTESGGGTVVDSGGEALPVCVGQPCPEGRNTFRLDAALARFTALAQIAGTGVDIVVTSPAGDALTVSAGENGTGSLGPVELEWEWVDETTARITGELPGGQRDEWTGEWSATLVAGNAADASTASPNVSFSYFTDWEPILVGEPEIVRARPNEIRVEIRDDAGNLVDPEATNSSLSLTADMTDPTTGAESAAEVGRDGDRFVLTVSAPEGSTGAELDLTTRLSVTTESGLTLVPQTRVYTLAALAPSALAAFDPTELRLDAIRGAGSTSGDVTVQASDNTAVCVWFDVPPIAGPASAEMKATLEPDATTRRDCVEIPAGESVGVRFSFTTDAEGNGTVRGTIEAATMSIAAPQEPERTSLAYSFELAEPINEAARWGLFALILLLGILAPIGVLGLVNRRLARFGRADNLVVARVPLRVERTVSEILRVYAGGDSGGDSVMRDDRPSSGALISAEDFSAVLPTREGGGYRIRGIHFVPARPSNPFSDVFGIVTSDDGPVAARVLGDPAADQDRMPLALAGAWMVVTRSDGEVELVDPQDNRIWLRVELVVLLAADNLRAQTEALTADLLARVGSATNELRDRIGTRPVDRAGDLF